MKKTSLLNLIILIILMLSACSTAEEANNPSTGPNQGSQTSDPSNSPGEQNDQSDGGETDIAFIENSWNSSMHASNFVLDNGGNNNTCAKCHSPVNFMPSMDDIPDSCLTCKFEIADPEPLIPEKDWLNIPCRTCHKLDKKDNVLPEIFWLTVPQIDEYASVDSADEICLKCHISTEIFTGHPGTNLAGVHSEYLCIECHDPHSTTASCGASECHDLTENIDVVIAGHDEDHQNVSCAACHDSGEFEVKPNDEGIWVTYLSNTESADDPYPFTSHNIVLEVDCGRCHYLDNPWGLSDDVVQ